MIRCFKIPIKLCIALICLLICSCSLNEKQETEDVNDPYFYSDSLLNEYQIKYDKKEHRYDSLQQVVDGRYDSLLTFFNKIGYQKGNDLFDMISNIRRISVNAQNFYVLEANDLIKRSKDLFYGFDFNSKEFLNQHYKTIYINDLERLQLLSIHNLKNRGDYALPNELYIGNDRYFDPPCVYIVDSLLSLKEKVTNSLISHQGLINSVDVETVGNISLQFLEEEYVVQFKAELLELFSMMPKENADLLIAVNCMLTLPEIEIRNGEYWPWIASRLDRPILGALETLLDFNIKIESSEALIFDYFLQKLEE